jgi:hypothetical protein
MTILEHTPEEEDILDFLDQSIRQIAETGAEARFILMGQPAYDRFRTAMARKLKRSAGLFETYQYVTVVVDPFRDDEVCVVPSAADAAKGLKPFRVPS